MASLEDFKHRGGPGKLHPKLIPQNTGSHMLEHSEHQCSRTYTPGVGQISMCTRVPCLCASPGTLGCLEQHTSSVSSREQQPKHHGWQPGQATSRGSDDPWIHPSPGFPLRAQGPAFPALITALGLSIIFLSIFRLWMLPSAAGWDTALHLSRTAPQRANQKPARGTSRDPCPRQEPKLKSNKTQSV